MNVPLLSLKFRRTSLPPINETECELVESSVIENEEVNISTVVQG